MTDKHHLLVNIIHIALHIFLRFTVVLAILILVKAWKIFSNLYLIIYKGQLKSSLADQDTLIECDQMKFLFLA